MPINEIILGLNIALFVALVLGFLGGMLKGFRKGLVMLILTIVWYGLAIAIIPSISRLLLDVNMSFLNNYIPGDFGTFTSIKESLPLVLQESFPEQRFLFVPGSDTLELIYGVITLLFNIILLVVFVILHGTIFRIINHLIWIFFKPKKKEDGTKPPKRRLLGGLVGSVKALMIMLLFAIPMAGLFSITNSLVTFVPPEEREGLGLMADEETLYFSDIYRESLLGKMFSISQVEDAYLDEYLFDSFFKIRVELENKKESLRIRKDIKHISNIYQRILDINENEPEMDESLLYKISRSDLEYINKNLSSMDLFKFVQIIGSEYVYNLVIEQELNNGYEELLTLNNLKKINLNKDLETIGEIIILLSEFEFGSEDQNIFMFDEETVSDALDKLVEIEWLKYLLPIAVNMLFNSDNMQTAMLQNNIDPDDIVKPSADSLLEDINNFKNVYIAFKNIGLTNFDDIGNILKNEDIEFTDENVEALIEAIFGFNILTDNTDLISYYIYESMFSDEDNDFANLISKEDLNSNFNSEELTSLVLFLKTIMESGVMNEEGDLQDLLTTERIEKLATHISNSNILSGGIMVLFESFLGDEITLVIPQEVTLKGAQGKTELIAFFNAIKLFADGDFDPMNLSELELENFADKLTSSKIIAHNLKNIIENLIVGDSLGFDIEIPEDITFYGSEGKAEVIALFKAFSKLSNEDLDLFNMGDTELEEFAEILTNSKIIAHNLKNIIGDFLEDNETGVNFVIPEDIEFYGTEGKNEIVALFKVLREIKDGDLLGSGIFDLDEEEIDDFVDLLTDSKIIAHNLKPLIKSLLNSEATTIGKSLTIPEDVTFEGTAGKEHLKDLFNGMNAAKNLTTFDYSSIDDSSKASVKANFKVINKSVILRPVLSNILTGSGVSTIDKYRYKTTDTNYKDPDDFDEQEWNDEIDILVDLVALINDGFDIDNPSTSGDYLIKYGIFTSLITSSKLYNEEEILELP